MNANVPHLVLDIGGYKTKAGFSGNSMPSEVVATPPDIFYNKIAKNFINYERHLANLCATELSLETVGKSAVVVESPFENQQNRSKIYEIMFETFAFDKVALVSDASMALYSHYLDSHDKKQDVDVSNLTGVVIDLGELQTSIVPVVEGYTIQRGIINFPINGKRLTKLISDNVSKLNPNLPKDLTSAHFKELVRVVKESKAATSLSHITEPKGDKKLEVSVKGKVQ